MKNIVVVASACLALLLIGGGGYWLGKSETAPGLVGNVGAGMAQPAGRPAPAAPQTAVEVYQAKPVRMSQGLTAVGSLRSDESVIIRPEVSGRIIEIGFREGQRVNQGATLIRFDASVQRAELEQAEANLALSRSRLERSRDLFSRGVISTQARDEAESNFKVAQANCDLAKARLSKLEIKAPFSGIVGLRSVSIGDYVKDGQDIVNLEEIDPLKVDFRIPEIYLKHVATGQTLQITLDAFPGLTFPGQVLAINPLVDVSGRSLVIRALIRNDGARLRPGMFARVRLLFSEEHDTLAVPEQSLIPVGDEHYLFKVVDGRAQRAKVEIGQRRDGRVEVLQGLTAGEVVVTAGQLKLRDGVPVSIVADRSPAAGAQKPAANPASTALPGDSGSAATTGAK